MISCWSVGEECQDQAKSLLDQNVKPLLIFFKLTICLKSLLIFCKSLVEEVDRVAYFLPAKHHNRTTGSVVVGFQGLDLSSQLVDEHRVVVAVEVNVVQHLLLSSPGQSLKAGFLGQELAKSHPEVHEGR